LCAGVHHNNVFLPLLFALAVDSLTCLLIKDSQLNESQEGMTRFLITNGTVPQTPLYGMSFDLIYIVKS